MNIRIGQGGEQTKAWEQLSRFIMTALEYRATAGGREAWHCVGDATQHEGSLSTQRPQTSSPPKLLNEGRKIPVQILTHSF